MCRFFKDIKTSKGEGTRAAKKGEGGYSHRTCAEAATSRRAHTADTDSCTVIHTASSHRAKVGTEQRSRLLRPEQQQQQGHRQQLHTHTCVRLHGNVFVCLTGEALAEQGQEKLLWGLLTLLRAPTSSGHSG